MFVGKTTSGVLDIETQGKNIINGVAGESVALKSFTRLPDMSSSQHSIPVSTQLATAKFVNGEGGKKPNSIAKWDKKTLVAEEIAVIIPISEQIIEDTSYDIFGQLEGQVIEAFGSVIDNAIFYGTGKPASWEAGIIPTAKAKDKKVVGTADLYKDIMGEDGLIAKVEESGFFVDGYYSSIGARGKLRGLVGTDKMPIFVQNMKDTTAPYTLDGMPLHFNRNGAELGVGTNKDVLVAGDFKQAVYSIRQDIKWELKTDGVITDDEGKIVLNGLENNMVFLRFVMRLGWALPNPINRIDSSDNRYPFAVLTAEEDIPSA